MPIIGPETDLVTLTIGGNDADFARVLRFCLALPDCHAQAVDFDGTTLAEALPLQIENLVRPALQQTLAEIRTRAPNAAVILAGYPLLSSPATPSSLVETSAMPSPSSASGPSLRPSRPFCVALASS